MNSQYTPYQVLRTGFMHNSIVTVTSNKKLLPKDLQKKGLLGAQVKFNKLIGQQASIKFTTNFYIPVKAILGYKEYNVLSEPCEVDTMFVVGSTHPTLHVGTVFTATLFKRDGSNSKVFAYLDDKGNTVELHSSVFAINKVVTKSKSKSIEQLLQKYGSNTPSVVKDIASVSQVTKTTSVKTVEEESLTPFLESVSKDYLLFKHTHSKMSEVLSKTTGVYIDMTGVKHKTVDACILANQSIIDRMYLSLAKDILTTEINSRN